MHSSKFEGGLIAADKKLQKKSTKRRFIYFYCSLLQAAIASTALKTLISLSTVVLLGLILAYHSLEVQVRPLIKYS